MSRQDIRELLTEIIADIAPEIDLRDATGDEHLQETYGLDSMDFLSILAELSERTGVDVPESDYDQVMTLNGLVTYVKRKKT